MRTRVITRSVLIGLACFFAAAARADTWVQIREVGLRGAYNPLRRPTRIAVQVTNPGTREQTLDLRASTSLAYLPEISPRYVAHSRISLRAGESRLVEVPMVLPLRQYPTLTAELYDAEGKLLGRDQLELASHMQKEGPVAIVCAAPAVCEQIESAIRTAGKARNTAGGQQSLRFVNLGNPPAMGWPLSTASTVVVAVPEAQLSTVQKQALETYLRGGGRLLLVEDLLRGRASSPASFLAPYRLDRAERAAQAVGHGELHDLSGMNDPRLGEMGARPSWIRPSGIEKVVGGLATHFQFPGLGWLLGWMAAYTLAVGVLNFAILRRIGRREWGWITMPALSVLFACGLYVASAARRPAQIGLDDLSVYWMDDRSNTAAVERRLRISSPHAGKIRLQVSGDNSFEGSLELLDAGRGHGSILKSSAGNPWSLYLGDPLEFQFPIAQWAFVDLELSGIRNLAGTVRRQGAGVLRNETGQDFRQAVYVTESKIFFLGELMAGAESDLAAARAAPTDNLNIIRIGPADERSPAQKGPSSADKPVLEIDPATGRQGGKEAEPFFLISELIPQAKEDRKAWLGGSSGVFLGLSKDSPGGAEMEGRTYLRRQYLVTIVSFGREP